MAFTRLGFTPGEENNASAEFSRPISLDGYEDSGNVGHYELNSNLSELKMVPTHQDLTNLNNSNYVVKLEATYVTGNDLSVGLTFKPVIIASETVKDKAVKTYVYFKFAREIKYTDSNTSELVDIFDLPYDATNYITIHPAGTTGVTEDDRNYIWTDNEDGTFSVDFSELDTIAELVKMNGTFNLSSIEKYTDFQSTVGTTCGILMHVSTIAPTPVA